MSDNNPFLEKKVEKRNWAVFLVEVVAIILTILVVGYLLVINPNEVDGPSMNPNFATNQLLFVNKLYATPLGQTIGMNYQRGDVVVFKFPQQGNKEVVKRVIGLPGEQIRLEDGIFYINGTRLTEKFATVEDVTKQHDFLIDGGPSKTIPPNNYFLVGDNREESADSRKFGFIPKELIIGKVILRVSPLSAFSFIGTGEYTLQ